MEFIGLFDQQPERRTTVEEDKLCGMLVSDLISILQRIINSSDLVGEGKHI